MAKSYMTRRGKKYQIERKDDGTFGKFIPVVKKVKTTEATKKVGTKKKKEGDSVQA